ncbi:leucyl aminopeptidase [Malaciobacter molluscorum LMG 25693]|uniref:Probable cytosol aminopeptidase n=1 Tax=Malaciobacter molluscorum LMG 25693 TaxID=870501 RepID=A0A2G1DFE3_9BACT|nr:leucyl aminopeptidase [Malaciobacter molluscorum]AXX91772.1 leucyl aminopeptidase, peptidase M17 family [Malaciobacter molluscorum LMG 25693]PHO17232.1 leucyl aminopeptidase [Malaciobacter molluscorum LMG 25693]
MKINLVEKTKKLKSSIEIIILSDIEESKDKKVLKTLNFEPKDETSVFLVESNKIYVGCENQDYDSVAIAIATAIKKFISTTTKSAKIVLSDTTLLNAIVEGALLGSYSFTTYKSDKQKCKKQELNIVVEKVTNELEKVVENSIIISDNVNKVRDMVNTTPADFYPEVMAKKAEEIAVENELECKILGEKYLEKHSMNAMLSVGRASVHESKLIHLSYKPKDAKKKVVLVGKGLTYDSGGLSLKPADYMTTMKSDKSGGCAVLGIINAVSILKLPIEIHAIVGAVENMIGGDAYKPDDVLTARNGKTIEVKNTDAEGRLVLADCLCYAQDEIENIDYIFDYATLTGACVVGVGEYTTGIMGNCEKLKRKAVSNALISGEYATSLDFNRFLRKTLKSEVADINNISSTRYGGAITAGIFLDNFINKENKDKWLHFDIAGPAYVEKAWGYNPFGASGAGVRMTLELLKNL